MAGRSAVKSLLRAVQALEGPKDPLGGLEAVRRVREAAEDLEKVKVREARLAGVTWGQIGSLYEISKQAAQQRFGGEGKSEERG